MDLYRNTITDKKYLGLLGVIILTVLIGSVIMKTMQIKKFGGNWFEE